MSGALRPLHLLRNVRRDTLGDTDARDYNPGLYRTIGNVTFSILPRRKKPRLSKFVLEKSIAAIVAQRLADLGPVHALFTFELCADTTFIPHFTDAASLEEILEVRASWPFDPEHTQILGADILAGISSLHDVGLQRNRFDVADILLVCRENMYSFQIAGLENCTCTSGYEPTNLEELVSLVHILKYVDERIEPSGYPMIQGFVRFLEASKTLDSTSIKAASRFLPAEISELRRELEIYLHAVRIFGTALGGNTAGKKGSR
ncbi:hypothetical protein CC80DRAFT_552847 [Byssothecium circinans]|uniref:Protein kinase domain-containing protein n=1 Tax=Byssothecium circinans TaxID=147558 RepID=A0A6A5TH36_9PLEO|nr:hypothetical protein CC80DRAFT_552847 [Byssothecium circinans]